MEDFRYSREPIAWVGAPLVLSLDNRELPRFSHTPVR